MERIAQVVADYVRPYIGDMNSVYVWPIDVSSLLSELPDLRLTLPKVGDYDRTIKFKESILPYFLNDDLDQREKIATYWLTQWGQINNLKPETIRHYIDTIFSNNHITTFTGIASWSKLAALKNPAYDAIYDSRVAFALNSLQALYQPKHFGGSLFPSPEGRNKIIANATTVIYLNKKDKWPLVPKKNVYTTYLQLIKLAAQLLTDCTHTTVEMVLFSRSAHLAEHLLANTKITIRRHHE